MRGHLEERSPGHWRVRVFVGRNLQGRPVYRSSSFRSPPGKRRDAEKVAAIHVAQLLQRKADAGTVAALIEDREHSTNRPRGPATADRERPILERIRRDFGPVRVEDLTAWQLDQWYRALASEGRSASTVHHYHAVFRALLIQAERWGWIARSPHRNASPPQPAPREIAPPPIGTVAALIERATAIDREFGLAVRLAAATGIRRGELLALRWSDIDGTRLNVRRALVEAKGRVTIGPTKGKRARALELDEATSAALAAHLHRLGTAAQACGIVLPVEGYIIADRRRDPWGMSHHRPNWLTLKWQRLTASAGVRVRWHDLRHFHATELVGAAVPMTTVSKRLGHAKTSTTSDIYSHALPTGDEAAAAAIGRLLDC